MSCFLVSSILTGRASYNGEGGGGGETRGLRKLGTRGYWRSRAYSLDSHMASFYKDTSCISALLHSLGEVIV